MRQSIGKTRTGRIVGLIAIASAVLFGTALTASDAAAQAAGCVSSAGTVTQPDHLKCYRVGADPFINPDLLSLDSPQFGIEPGCQVKGHAVQFCVPVCKTIVGPVPPPTGTGFQATTPLTDDELCYSVTCTTNNAPRKLGVTDQFAARTVTMGAADLICAPAAKLPAPPCGFVPGATVSAAQCGGACPDTQACKFTPPKKTPTGVIPASCNCAQVPLPCGNTAPPTVAPICGGSCPETANGAMQLCRDLGGNCTCTTF
jgi:hypothetical protein